MNASVLLLNANMIPIRVVSLQRAISLISKGTVDVIEDDPDRKLRSPSVTWAFPVVLRLRYYANVPQRRAVWSRRAVFSRDSYTCQYCGYKLSREDATVDHITPRETCDKLKIRASTWTNTCCSCPKCNRRKANRTMRDAGMKFFFPDFEPKAPRVNYLVLSGEVPQAWRAYLKM